MDVVFKAPERIPVHKPQVDQFGLYAEHDHACSVFWDQDEKSVYNCNEGVFEPSWRAQDEGWMLVCVAPGWRRWLVQKIAAF